MRFPQATPEATRATTVALALALFLFLTSCGVSRDASPEALTADDTTAQDDASPGADDEEAAATTTTQPPEPTPPPSTAPAADVAITADFGDETWELTHGDLNEVAIATWENTEFTTLAFGGPVPDGFYTGVAYEHLVGKIFDRLLVDAGGAVAAADEAEPKASLMNIMQSWFGTSADPEAEADRLYQEVPYLPFLVSQQAKQVALTNALSDSGELTVEAPCVRHILLDDQAAAQEVRELLDGGSDFAELAAERSTGPTGPNGGDLGCSPSSSYVPEFAAAVDSATVGEFVGPIETQFGWHVLVVEGYEDTELDPAQVIGEQIQTALVEASIEVDPRLGTWDSDQLTIIQAAETE